MHSNIFVNFKIHACFSTGTGFFSGGANDLLSFRAVLIEFSFGLERLDVIPGAFLSGESGKLTVIERPALRNEVFRGQQSQQTSQKGKLTCPAHESASRSDQKHPKPWLGSRSLRKRCQGTYKPTLPAELQATSEPTNRWIRDRSAGRMGRQTCGVPSRN